MDIIKYLFRPLFRLAVRLALWLLQGFFIVLRLVLPKDKYYRARATIAERAPTECLIGGLRFHINHPIGYFRAREFLRVEPDLVHWIDDFIDENSILYDVGANIGAYSLYAARKGARVIAFEPFAGNYSLLNQNIQLNGMGDRISAFNLALHDTTGVNVLNISKFAPGGAIHAVGVTRAGSSFEEFEPVHGQSVVAFRLDDFVGMFDQPFPTHVKIDVDGNDPLVLAGMSGLFSDERLKHIAIEVNPKLREADQGVVDTLESFGFESLVDDRYLNPSVNISNKAYNAYFVRKA